MVEKVLQLNREKTLFWTLVSVLLLSLGFYIFGIPEPLFWASLSAIVGAIPGVGTLAGLVPSVAYLFFKGTVIYAIGLAVFGFIVIVIVDNLMTTHFFGKGLEVSSLFVLLSIIGGIVFLGPLGFILGPLILSVFLSMLSSYNQCIHQE